MFADWFWKRKTGFRMINKVASSFHVSHRIYCMTNCTMSPICDSYNYRPSDKTCQLNTHDTQHIILDSCVHAGSSSDKTCQFNTRDTQHVLDSCVHAGSSSDKTCQFNTRDTQHVLDSCVHTGNGLVLLTRRASSTHTTLNTL